MRRKKQSESPHGGTTDDNAALTEFVRALVELTAAACSSEQLFADDALDGCLRLILAKNQALDHFGRAPWPEGLVVQATRSQLDRLRTARLH
ncbi:MAG: hypothetical protein WA702_04845 [Bradyrhizobium sp.]|jgi:hypothetical protein|uniref:hypothetical protein n=1 Tax=Bradyrhizobium sp. TaxID=376 RepID=UPI003C7B1DCF